MRYVGLQKPPRAEDSISALQDSGQQSVHRCPTDLKAQSQSPAWDAGSPSHQTHKAGRGSLREGHG